MAAVSCNVNFPAREAEISDYLARETENNMYSFTFSPLMALYFHRCQSNKISFIGINHSIHKGLLPEQNITFLLSGQQLITISTILYVTDNICMSGNRTTHQNKSNKHTFRIRRRRFMKIKCELISYISLQAKSLLLYRETDCRVVKHGSQAAKQSSVRVKQKSDCTFFCRLQDQYSSTVQN